MKIDKIQNWKNSKNLKFEKILKLKIEKMILNY